ncbi:formin-like protein 14 [Oryza sativa Japonica Group]|uniref:formin-like protein 14 n=1 Tax=Oryza sativa subsp. japonica TaxID=39947 RepID=UPI00339CE9E1
MQYSALVYPVGPTTPPVRSFLYLRPLEPKSPCRPLPPTSRRIRRSPARALAPKPHEIGFPPPPPPLPPLFPNFRVDSSSTSPTSPAPLPTSNSSCSATISTTRAYQKPPRALIFRFPFLPELLAPSPVLPTRAQAPPLAGDPPAGRCRRCRRPRAAPFAPTASSRVAAPRPPLRFRNKPPGHRFHRAPEPQPPLVASSRAPPLLPSLSRCAATAESFIVPCRTPASDPFPQIATTAAPPPSTRATTTIGRLQPRRPAAPVVTDPRRRLPRLRKDKENLGHLFPSPEIHWTSVFPCVDEPFLPSFPLRPAMSPPRPL